MNKLNNNEVLQITTVMPTMKKSLLALAVAGTMAMSGGAYAAAVGTTVTVTDDTTAGTLTGSSTAITAPVGVVLTVTDGNATNDISVAADTAVDRTIQTVSKITISDAAAVTSSVGAINLSGTDSITIINDNDAATSTLTIGAVTGTGTLIVSGTAGDVSSAFTVAGSALGTSSVALAEVEVIGGVGHATNNNAATLTTSSTLNTTLLTVTGGAGVAGASGLVDGNAATATIGGNAIIGGGGIALTGGAAFAVDGTTGGAATLTLSGTTTITGGAVTVTGGAGKDPSGHETTAIGGASAITFTGDVTSDSALTLVSGATDVGAGGAATATFGGDATFSAITLTKVGGAAGMTFNGAAAQTITGTIVATTNDTGSITVSNTHASGVTFASSIGGATADTDDLDDIIIGTVTAGSVATFNSTVMLGGDIVIGLDASETVATTEGSSATFKGNVTATNIILGNTTDSDIKTNNATFTGTLTVAAILKGLAEEDVNTVTMNGGTSEAPTIVTLSVDMGANIDTLAIGDFVTLNSTTASTPAITAGAITIGASGVLKTTITGLLLQEQLMVLVLASVL